jgi:transposase
MPDEPKPTSERARKRAAGKMLRELSIRRREAYFDQLVSGYSVEQIASQTQKSPSTARRALGQALAKRRLDAPEEYARLQVARLTKAIAPFVKVVRERNLTTASMLARRDWPRRRRLESRSHHSRLRSRTRPAWRLQHRSKTKKVARKNS